MSGRDYPDDITPELRRVLGLMYLQTGPIAHRLRSAGADVPGKIEAEQAFVLHWLIKLALDHPDDWQERASAEIERCPPAL